MKPFGKHVCVLFMIAFKSPCRNTKQGDKRLNVKDARVCASALDKPLPQKDMQLAATYAQSLT
jgi:hypothetical protein